MVVRHEPAPLFTVDGIRVLGLRVPGRKAQEMWRELSQEGPSAGWWPCVLGPDIDAPGGGARHVQDILHEGVCEYQSIHLGERRLQQAERAGPGAMVRQWLEAPPAGATLEQLIDGLSNDRPMIRIQEDERPYIDWDEAELEASEGKLTVPFDTLSGAPHPELRIALLPTEHSWEALAFMKFGGFNDCPPSEVHVGRIRRWHEQFGAQIASVSKDVIELMVERPPMDEESCHRLALEQYRYCSDVVDQGCGSVEALAHSLWGAKSWSFWWD